MDKTKSAMKELIIDAKSPLLRDSRNPVIPPAASLLILSSCLRKAINEHSATEKHSPKFAKDDADLGAVCLIAGKIFIQYRFETPFHVMTPAEYTNPTENATPIVFKIRQGHSSLIFLSRKGVICLSQLNDFLRAQ